MKKKKIKKELLPARENDAAGCQSVRDVRDRELLVKTLQADLSQEPEKHKQL